jgi:hypothetical protein
MKNRVLLAVLSGALALATSAWATTTDDVVSASLTAYVGKMGSVNNTQTEAFIVDENGNAVSCQGFDTKVYIARAHARHQLMFDSLLAAKLAGRSVELHYQAISSQCWVKRVLIH